jgi:hypothetical protein
MSSTVIEITHEPIETPVELSPEISPEISTEISPDISPTGFVCDVYIPPSLQQIEPSPPECESTSTPLPKEEPVQLVNKNKTFLERFVPSRFLKK